MMNQEFQYLIDEKGKKTAVIVPIRDWLNLQKQLKEFEEYRRLEGDLSRAMEEVNDIKNGEIEAQTLKDFLNDC